ncbi:hypothetical protein DIPPA_31411 [Diplonema papillatum]|nr:hypothetical protein DIPPA_31411 [Diplonema papillatum]
MGRWLRCHVADLIGVLECFVGARVPHFTLAEVVGGFITERGAVVGYTDASRFISMCGILSQFHPQRNVGTTTRALQRFTDAHYGNLQRIVSATICLRPPPTHGALVAAVTGLQRLPDTRAAGSGDGSVPWHRAFTACTRALARDHYFLDWMSARQLAGLLRAYVATRNAASPAHDSVLLAVLTELRRKHAALFARDTSTHAESIVSSPLSLGEGSSLEFQSSDPRTCEAESSGSSRASSSGAGICTREQGSSPAPGASVQRHLPLETCARDHRAADAATTAAVLLEAAASAAQWVAVRQAPKDLAAALSGLLQSLEGWAHSQLAAAGFARNANEPPAEQASNAGGRSSPGPAASQQRNANKAAAKPSGVPNSGEQRSSGPAASQQREANEAPVKPSEVPNTGGRSSAGPAASHQRKANTAAKPSGVPNSGEQQSSGPAASQQREANEAPVPNTGGRSSPEPAGSQQRNANERPNTGERSHQEAVGSQQRKANEPPASPSDAPNFGGRVRGTNCRRPAAEHGRPVLTRPELLLGCALLVATQAVEPAQAVASPRAVQRFLAASSRSNSARIAVHKRRPARTASAGETVPTLQHAREPAGTEAETEAGRRHDSPPPHLPKPKLVPSCPPGTRRRSKSGVPNPKGSRAGRHVPEAVPAPPREGVPSPSPPAPQPRTLPPQRYLAEAVARSAASVRLESLTFRQLAQLASAASLLYARGVPRLIDGVARELERRTPGVPRLAADSVLHPIRHPAGSPWAGQGMDTWMMDGSNSSAGVKKAGIRAASGREPPQSRPDVRGWPLGHSAKEWVKDFCTSLTRWQAALDTRRYHGLIARGVVGIMQEYTASNPNSFDDAGAEDGATASHSGPPVTIELLLEVGERLAALKLVAPELLWLVVQHHRSCSDLPEARLLRVTRLLLRCRVTVAGPYTALFPRAEAAVSAAVADGSGAPRHSDPASAAAVSLATLLRLHSFASRCFADGGGSLSVPIRRLAEHHGRRLLAGSGALATLRPTLVLSLFRRLAAPDAADLREAVPQLAQVTQRVTALVVSPDFVASVYASLRGHVRQAARVRMGLAYLGVESPAWKAAHSAGLPVWRQRASDEKHVLS